MIIWGFRPKSAALGQVQYQCPKCQQVSFHTVVHTKRWFTLFFIPVFPFSNSVTSRCNLCGYRQTVDKATANQWFPKGPGAG